MGRTTANSTTAAPRSFLFLFKAISSSSIDFSDSFLGAGLRGVVPSLARNLASSLIEGVANFVT
jgi:hypothetical protein